MKINISKLLAIACFAFVAILVSPTSMMAQTDAIDKFFSDYEDNENFSVVYVSPKMFQMITKVAGEEMEDDIMDVIKDIKALKILRTEVNSKAIYKEASSRIKTNEYEVLLTAREEGQNIKFLTKTSQDIVQELLLIVGGDEEFILLSFVGNLDLDKISKLASSLDLDGAEHLKQLKKK